MASDSSTLDLPRVETESFAPEGGLDIVTPPFQLRNGVAISASNYEVDLVAGAARISGYDRFVNGRTMAEQDFRLATITNPAETSVEGAQTIFTGDRLIGQSSGASLVFISSPNQSGGTNVIFPGTTAEQCYVAEVEGTFIVGEALQIDFAVGHPWLLPQFAIIETKPIELPGDTPEEKALARQSADNSSRGLMQKPNFLLASGLEAMVGQILGIFMLDDLAVVARSDRNARVNFFAPEYVPEFSGYRPHDNRQWRHIGATPIPSSGAKFEFVVDTLGSSQPLGDPTYGLAQWRERCFGVSGTYKAFVYYDGAFEYITSGLVDDRPEHICVHGDRLVLSYRSEVMLSEPGLPFGWRGAFGAKSFSVGQNVTGVMSLTGESQQSALLIATEERLYILYGTLDGDFQMVPFAQNSGALPGTVQWMGKALFQNAFGLTSLGATQAFGGFAESVYSSAIKPFLDKRARSASCSMIVRNKNQYRVFFDDGSGVYVTFRASKNGAMVPSGMFPVQLSHVPSCSWSCITRGTKSLPAGEEVLLFGTQDGEVMRLDVGWSFAGFAIAHHLRLAFNHLKSPRLLKHFKRALVELQAAGYADFLVGYDLDYRGPERAITADQELLTDEQGANQFWSDSRWTQFRWDVTTTSPKTFDTPGNGVNFSLRFQGNDAVTQPFTITGVILNYIFRRVKR